MWQAVHPPPTPAIPFPSPAPFPCRCVRLHFLEFLAVLVVQFVRSGSACSSFASRDYCGFDGEEEEATDGL
uniref:Uncharacterized protein n=1 Tax=Arundo donax TaxID=35708 RepID=A0A0A9DPG8_ARUDO